MSCVAWITSLPAVILSNVRALSIGIPERAHGGSSAGVDTRRIGGKSGRACALLDSTRRYDTMTTAVLERVERVAGEARRLKAAAADAMETGIYDAAHRIRKYPFISVGAAFAVGVPLGLLAGWALTRPRASK
jgi:ElaB/YqjD/DUF883 family membrane-anchored ribosome-binding protein